MNATLRLIFDNGGGTVVHVLADELLIAAAHYRDASLAARDAVQIIRTGLLPGATERLALALDAATTAPTSDQVRAGLYVVQLIEPGDNLADVAASLRQTEWANAVAFADALIADMPEPPEPDYNATISERGNGLPDVGDYVPGDNGELYRVVRMSCIHTSAYGAGDYIHAVLEPADWDDVSSDDEVYPAGACLESEVSNG